MRRGWFERCLGSGLAYWGGIEREYTIIDWAAGDVL